MRILFFSYAYPTPWQPGTGTFNRTMISALAERHAVRVVAPVPFPERIRRPQQSTSTFAAVPAVQADYPTYFYTPKVLRSQYDRFLWWSVRRPLFRAINELGPDVVLSYWSHPDGAVAVRAARAVGLPAVVMVGGSDVLVLGRSGSRRAAILQTLHQADAVIAVSQDISQTLQADGIAAGKIHVIGRGVDSGVFCPGDQIAARRELGLPPDRPVLLGAGRLVPVKDWMTWLAACEQLVARGLQPASYVCGAGPLEGALRTEIERRGLSDFVELRGSQSPHQLAKWYRAADLTVLSSISEGIPNVLLETIACGGSFVATAVGGIAEIADSVHDRLVPAQNPTALAAAIVDRLERAPSVGCQRRFYPENAIDSANRLSAVLAGAARDYRKHPRLPLRGGEQPSWTRLTASVAREDTSGFSHNGAR